MPVTLAQIAANTASVTFHWGEDSVTVVYYPGRVTEKVIAELQNMASLSGETMAAGFTSFNSALARLVKSWDVLDDSVDPPVMFPLSRLPDLPVGFRIQVISAIMGDLRPEAMAPQMTALNGKL